MTAVTVQQRVIQVEQSNHASPTGAGRNTNTACPLCRICENIDSIDELSSAGK